jgi:lantibiotic modifying enzyme
MAKKSSDDERITRRALLEGGLGTAALLSLPEGWRRLLRDAFAPPRPYYDAALKAEKWIAKSAIHYPTGTAWPADPEHPLQISTDLYSGSAGVVLFYLELAAATGDREMLELAASGADYLIATLPPDAKQIDMVGAGLYVGAAGTAYALERVHAATGRAIYMEGAKRAMALVHGAQRAQATGADWNGANDVMVGNAGIGLAMLWAERALNDAQAREAAVQSGRYLVKVGIPELGGLKWELSPEVPRRYPNFSHGTGGVAYFLATLYLATKDKTFLDAAVAGAVYLDAISVATGPNGRKIFHHEPGGEQLFYMSWCHGAAGTARLYHQLGIATGDAKWKGYVPKLAQGVIDSGVPETHPDLSGYWNNISQCCGNSGVCEFFLAMYGMTKKKDHLTYAVRVANDALARATVDGDGLKWIQAENRISPKEVIAQTGMMQGAAGVGLAMLHLDAVINERPRTIVLPDVPWYS